jgi:hypothetical protein
MTLETKINRPYEKNVTFNATDKMDESLRIRDGIWSFFKQFYISIKR